MNQKEVLKIIETNLITKRKGHLFTILTSLLYPAILGAVIYDVFKIIMEHGLAGIIGQTLFLVFALVMLYVVDFSYTVVEVDDDVMEEKEVNKIYHLGMFLCDFIIVISLFIATKLLISAIDAPHFPENPKMSTNIAFWVIFCLCITKLFSVFWEIPKKKYWHLPSLPDALKLLFLRDASNVETGRLILVHYDWFSDALLMCVYLLFLGCAYFNSGNLWLDGNYHLVVFFLGLFVLFDFWTYIWHDKMNKLVMKKIPKLMASKDSN